MKNGSAPPLAERLERRQVPLYLAAIAIGVIAGLLAPQASAATAPAITPVLGLLLFVTFLQVPFGRIAASFRSGRFLVTILTVNFVVAPLVAFAVTRFTPATDGLLIGALLVLLAPCIDYVVAFAGLAGGAKDRLLAATPLLMICQTALLPGYLWLFVGPETSAVVQPAPLIEAFLLLIVLPLAAAVAVQGAARRAPTAARAAETAGVAMVPLMMATLAIVVASQLPGVVAQLPALAGLVPVFVVFAAAMTGLGMLAGRFLRLSRPDSRAVMFSGVTRNSLVVLPLALALPASAALAPLAVVTQTLVELVVLVGLVALFRRGRR